MAGWCGGGGLVVGSFFLCFFCETRAPNSDSYSPNQEDDEIYSPNQEDGEILFSKSGRRLTLRSL